MSASTYEDLERHVGHATAVVTYGSPPVNVAIECEDCNEVLLDFDRDGESARPTITIPEHIWNGDSNDDEIEFLKDALSQFANVELEDEG